MISDNKKQEVLITSFVNVPNTIPPFKVDAPLEFKQFTLWVDQRPESNKKQAKLLIGNIKVRITHWFSRDFWNSLKVGDRLEFAKEEGFLIITLSRPYQKDGLCYLLCSGILSPYDDWNM